MKLRCPVCHSSNSLETFTADAAGRELLQVLSGTGPLFQPLVHYLGLFRAASRDLTHGRALKLIREVMEISADPQHLATALHDTVEAMRGKRYQGDHRPLKNHNYLKRVLESVRCEEIGVRGNSSHLTPHTSPSVRPGKRAQAIHLLGDWAKDNWLRLEIAQGLAALIGLGRQGAPAVDTVIITAGLWETLLISQQVTIQKIDQKRIQAGFKQLLNSFDGWPEPKDLLARMPRRPHRQQLDEPLAPDDRVKGKEFFKNMRKEKRGPQ